ncbi:MAG: ABC-type bacteriocin/lantibiotic exporter with double-glycine peptidase domain [Chitinophagales bacterium]|jgi:ABC-type bacteriocin/lantibiotic exporter with double-glycine peptidase domain
MKTMSPISRFIGLLKSEGESVKRIYIYAIFNGLVALSLPLGIQAIISFIQTGQITASWMVLVFIVVAGIVLAGWLQVLQLKTSERIQQRIYAKSALELAYRLPKIKSEEMYRFFAPELANRFFDTLTIQKGLSKILIDFTSALMQIAFGLLLLSFYHPFFILLGLLVTILLFMIIRFTFNEGLATSNVESKIKYETAHWLEEVARSVFSFKLSGDSELHIQKTDEITASYVEARKKHFSVLLKQYWSMIGFKAILASSLLLIGGFLVINQNMNIGQFVAAEIVILLVIGSVEKLILSAETIYDVLTAFDKLGAITDLELENKSDKLTAFKCDADGLAVELNELSFNYPGRPLQVLKGITLHIEAGEKVCFVGENSSGKASMLNIISTLYTPTDGIVKFHGYHCVDLDLHEIRTHIGSYLESEELFEGTLYENISLMRNSVKTEDVIEAINHVKLNDFINRDKNGLQTFIKPTGKTLSKSVVQKILLARSIVSKPKLLIIGNNLNNLSSIDKHHVVDYLCKKENPWTLLFSSNDYYVASKCDRVIALSQGEILTQGTFQELIVNPAIKNILDA